MSKFKTTIDKLFGQQLPVRERFFNIIFFAAAALGLFGVLACLVLNSSSQAITITAASAILLPTLAYIHARVEKKTTAIVYITMVIVNFLIFPAIYLAGGSIMSGVPAYFTLGIALTLFLTKGVWGVVLSVLESFWYGFIFFMSWRWPGILISLPAFATDSSERAFHFVSVISNTLVISIACGIVTKVIFDMYQKEVKLVGENIITVERQSIIDPLTAIYNRRYMYSYLESQVEFSRENETELSVVLFDIDLFKLLNDTYGHLVGDTTLKAIAGIIKNSCREGEIVARYGGEEFLLILPGMGHDDAMARAEEIRLCIEQSQLAPELPENAPVTISGGVCTLRKTQDEESLVAEADKRLYSAKELGRNRIIGEEVALW